MRCSRTNYFFPAPSREVAILRGRGTSAYVILYVRLSIVGP